MDSQLISPAVTIIAMVEAKKEQEDVSANITSYRHINLHSPASNNNNNYDGVSSESSSLPHNNLNNSAADHSLRKDGGAAEIIGGDVSFLKYLVVCEEPQKIDENDSFNYFSSEYEDFDEDCIIAVREDLNGKGSGKEFGGKLCKKGGFQTSCEKEWRLKTCADLIRQEKHQSKSSFHCLPQRINRLVLLCVLLILSIITGNIFFYWSPMEDFLLRMKFFSLRCPDNLAHSLSLKESISNHGKWAEFPLGEHHKSDLIPTFSSKAFHQEAPQAEPMCSHQQEAVASIRQVGLTSILIFGILGGFFVDVLSPRTGATLAILLQATGWLVLAFSVENMITSVIAVILIGSGGEMIFYAISRVSLLFPNQKVLIVSLIYLCRSTGFITPLFLNYLIVIFPNVAKEIMLCSSFAMILLFASFCTSLILPWEIFCFTTLGHTCRLNNPSGDIFNNNPTPTSACNPSKYRLGPHQSNNIVNNNKNNNSSNNNNNNNHNQIGNAVWCERCNTSHCNASQSTACASSSSSSSSYNNYINNNNNNINNRDTSFTSPDSSSRSSLFATPSYNLRRQSNNTTIRMTINNNNNNNNKNTYICNNNNKGCKSQHRHTSCAGHLSDQKTKYVPKDIVNYFSNIKRTISSRLTDISPTIRSPRYLCLLPLTVTGLLVLQLESLEGGGLSGGLMDQSLFYISVLLCLPLLGLLADRRGGVAAVTVTNVAVFVELAVALTFPLDTSFIYIYIAAKCISTAFIVLQIYSYIIVTFREEYFGLLSGVILAFGELIKLFVTPALSQSELGHSILPTKLLCLGLVSTNFIWILLLSRSSRPSTTPAPLSSVQVDISRDCYYPPNVIL